MIGRRTWLRLTCLLALLALLGGYGYYSWMRLLERQQIRQLDWQGASLSLQGIRLARLDLLQQSEHGSLRLQAERLLLSWRQFGVALPFWQHVQLGRLDVEWHPTANRPDAEPAGGPLDIQSLTAALPPLPGHLRIDQVVAELPCASGRCSLHSDLQLFNHARHPLDLELRLGLLSEANRLDWNLALQGTPDALDLRLALAINDRPQLQLRSSLSAGTAGTQWRGELSATDLSEAAALHGWLSQWAALPDSPLPSAPPAAQLAATWQLHFAPGALDPSHLQQASGRFEARAELPEPWPIPAIGQLQGSFGIAARGQQGQWFAERLTADLHLQQPFGDWLQQLPPALHGDSLRLRIQPTEALDALPSTLVGRALPLAVDLRSGGTTTVELQAALALANAPPWAVQVADARLTANSRQFAFDAWQLGELKAALRFSGYLDSQQLQLELGPGSRLDLGTLSGPDTRLQHMHGNAEGLRLQAQFPAGSQPSWQLQGPATLTVRRIEHSALKPQGWRWQGRLTADHERLALDGQLSADAGIQLRLQLQHDSNQGLRLQARLAELFLRAGNPLAETLADWPALLELHAGRLNGNASLRLPPHTDTPEAQLELTGKGLAGIYDRTALSGLDGRLQLSLAQRHLQIELHELRLQQANPGIPLGPLELRGHYRAPLARPDQGQLRVHQAQTAVMGGTVRLNPNHWNLAQDDLLFSLQLHGLQL
ncbi:hypothetical protein HP532_13575, partial [Pseudomonas sp. CrR25]|nr:hypothetical protein [Pseudomonas sp. CrR25]